MKLVVYGDLPSRLRKSKPLFLSTGNIKIYFRIHRPRIFPDKLSELPNMYIQIDARPMFVFLDSLYLYLK